MKNLKNLGIALSKAEQKSINGGLAKGNTGGNFDDQICTFILNNYYKCREAGGRWTDDKICCF